eukprot:5629613-Pleurochrysis_carterae.AAC.2
MTVILAATPLMQWQAAHGATSAADRAERASKRGLQEGCLLLLPPPALVVRGAGLPADLGRYCVQLLMHPYRLSSAQMHPFPIMRHHYCMHKAHGEISRRTALQHTTLHSFCC